MGHLIRYSVFVLTFLSFNIVSAQRPQAIAYKAYGSIFIDGYSDEKDWEMAPVNLINRIYQGEEASITGDSDLSGFWKVLYNDNGLYLFVSITDDILYTSADYGQSWEKDQVEIYLDMNTSNLIDGRGGQDIYNGIKGHYQISGIIDSASSIYTLPAFITDFEGSRQYLVHPDKTYTEEIFIPWESIPSLGDTIFKPDYKKVFGFDIYLIDNDGPDNGAARSRKVWANNGLTYENWTSMDSAGTILCKIDTSTLFVEKINRDTIKIDGDANEVSWAKASKINISKNFGTETFNNKADLSAYANAVYNDSGLYLLFKVIDDVHYTDAAFGQSWEKDRIEVFFDMNTDYLKNGTGPNDNMYYDGRYNGHYMIGFLSEPNQTLASWCTGCQVQTKVNTDNSYVSELYVPWSVIKSESGHEYIADNFSRFGFDVTISDNDGPTEGNARNRKVWMNDEEPESWLNMDGCGAMLCLLPVKPVQYITFKPLYETKIGDKPFKLTASASSGLPLTYSSSNTAVASIKGDSVYLISPGYTYITATQAGNDTLDPVSKKQLLVVNKVTLTAIAQDAIRYSGKENPQFKIIYQGFLGKDNENVIDVKPVITSTANKNSTAGIYNINVSGGKDNFYDFAYINGKLTIVNPAEISKEEDQINIYPNPASDKLFISNIPERNILIDIYNLEGEKVSPELKVVNNILNISALKPGLYILYIKTGNSVIFRKFIKK